MGVIIFEGQVIPVFNIRQRLHLPQRDLNLNDQFILAHTSRRLVALWVDSVGGIKKLEDRALVGSEQVLPGLEYIHGLAKLDDNLVLICDLDQFLSIDEERELETILNGNVVQSDFKIDLESGEKV